MPGTFVSRHPHRLIRNAPTDTCDVLNPFVVRAIGYWKDRTTNETRKSPFPFVSAALKVPSPFGNRDGDTCLRRGRW